MSKTWKSKSAFALSGMMVMSGLLAACSSGGQSEGGGAAKEGEAKQAVTITAAMQQHTAVDAIKAMLPDFEKQTGIKVKFDILPQEELHSKTELALASNSDQYDVVMMDMMFTTQYAKAGWVAPLDDMIAKKRSHRAIEGFP